MRRPIQESFVDRLLQVDTDVIKLGTMLMLGVPAEHLKRLVVVSLVVTRFCGLAVYNKNV